MAADRRFWAVIGVALTALLVHGLLGVTVGEDYVIPTTLVGVVGAVVALRGPLGTALARRIQGEGLGGEGPSEQVLGELDELRTRVAELEERVDFSERLLAKQRDATERLSS